MTLKLDNPNAIPAALLQRLTALPRVAVAFSGGVDSSYLLYAARTCGLDVHAYYVNAQFQPAFELAHAKQLAADVGADMTIIELDALASDTVVSNPADRCYHCKKVIFGEILRHAAADGYTVIIDGSNASDDANDRPGMKALAELKVLSPLREAGITKAQVRTLSREAGLFTWDKPAYACLATRVPTGMPLTNALLQKIENAEDKLFGLGFSDFRARIVDENTTKLQMPAAQLPVAAQKHAAILKALAPWFGDVLLDLKPR